MFRLGEVEGVSSETGGNWPHVKEENAHVHKSGEQLARAGVCSLPGVLAWKSWGAAHTWTRWPCRWSTRALRALIPLRRASRCSTEEIPRLIRSLQRRAGQSSQLTPTSCSPSPRLDREGPRSRTGWASHMGSGRAPGLLRLTGQSWRPRPPGSRSRLQRNCPCSGPGPGPPATHPRSRRRGRWRRHGPPAGWEA